MQKSTSRYKQGDIIILELPFTDLVGSKLRPVLVINKEDLGNDLIVLKINYWDARKVQSYAFAGRSSRRKAERESYIDCSWV